MALADVFWVPPTSLLPPPSLRAHREFQRENHSSVSTREMIPESLNPKDEKNVLWRIKAILVIDTNAPLLGLTGEKRMNHVADDC